MAYQGTTSTSPNPPFLVTQAMAYSSSNVTGSTLPKGLPRSWIYTSTHISSDIAAVNFFTDGLQLGMKPGDLLYHRDPNLVITSHSVLVVGSTTTDISVGTTIGLGA